MNCEEVRLLMIDYLDKNLDGEKQREISKHLENCRTCLEEISDLKKIIGIISDDEMQKPDESARKNFYNLLDSEIKAAGNPIKREENNTGGRTSSHRKMIRAYRVAAGIALFVTGILSGLLIGSGQRSPAGAEVLNEMSQEITDLKKTAMFSMLKDQSTSYRLQAVNFAEEIETPDENVINALVRALNNDRNVNVRMAAAYALSKYADETVVRDSLVNSLFQQQDPIVQVTLINILVEKREKNAIPPIQKIIDDSNTLNEVRSVAEDGIKMLL